ncbi:MAG: hypothetical protein ACRCTQ_06025 [Brevinemataceae bacterium]
MTLAEFICNICKEVLMTENPKVFSSIAGTRSVNSSISSKKKNLSKSSTIITETALRKMISDGSVSTISENSRFTPLASDLWQQFKRKN